MVKNKCVMCGDEVDYVAEANYKSGKERELLCERCAVVNKQIKKDKEFR